MNLETDSTYCESYTHASGDGVILLLPNKDTPLLDIEKQVSWSNHLLPNGEIIGIGRVWGGNIAAIHLPAKLNLS